MKLFRVTITGADDAVDPDQLIDLAHEFPFVEWGLLISPKRQGERRYPSMQWLRHFALRRLVVSPFLPVALHLCGRAARDVVAGRDQWLTSVRALESGGVRRIQINGFEDTQELVTLLDDWDEYEWILQARNASGLDDAVSVAGQLCCSHTRVTALWDASGGRGIAPSGWADPPMVDDVARLTVGYAGGINPDNVTQVIEAIKAKPYEGEGFWIDMESGVRTDDQFDLRKVRAVLETAAPYVEVSA